MALQYWFWITMFLWLLVGGWIWRASPEPKPLPYVGAHVLTFILFAILGYAQFGGPIK